MGIFYPPASNVKKNESGIIDWVSDKYFVDVVELITKVNTF